MLFGDQFLLFLLHLLQIVELQFRFDQQLLVGGGRRCLGRLGRMVHFDDRVRVLLLIVQLHRLWFVIHLLVIFLGLFGGRVVCDGRQIAVVLNDRIIENRWEREREREKDEVRIR